MKTILKLIVMVVLTMLMLSMTKCTSGSAEDRVVKLDVVKVDLNQDKDITSAIEIVELT
jgi:hypothetical protein